MSKKYTLLSFLKEVRELLSDKNKWIKGSFFKTSKDGPKTDLEDSPGAFCLLGAARFIQYKNRQYKNRIELLNKYGNALEDVLQSRGETRNIIKFNDLVRTTHKQVLNLLDTAITTQAKRE